MWNYRLRTVVSLKNIYELQETIIDELLIKTDSLWAFFSGILICN